MNHDTGQKYKIFLNILYNASESKTILSMIKYANIKYSVWSPTIIKGLFT